MRRIEADVLMLKRYCVRQQKWKLNVCYGGYTFGPANRIMGQRSRISEMTALLRDDVNARRRKPCREARDTMRHLVSQNVT